jgi:hypothetical protein
MCATTFDRGFRQAQDFSNNRPRFSSLQQVRQSPFVFCRPIAIVAALWMRLNLHRNEAAKVEMKVRAVPPARSE